MFQSIERWGSLPRRWAAANLIAGLISGAIWAGNWSFGPSQSFANFPADLLARALVTAALAGVCQWGVLRAYLPHASRWMLGTMVGGVAGWYATGWWITLCQALAGPSGLPRAYLESIWVTLVVWLIVPGVILGITVAVIQAWVVKARNMNARRWVLASALSGIILLAAPLVVAPFSLSVGPISRTIGSLALGGLAYGLITASLIEGLIEPSGRA